MDARIEQLETEYLRKLMARDAAVWRERMQHAERSGAPPDGWAALKSRGVKPGTTWSEARRKAQKRGRRAA